MGTRTKRTISFVNDDHICACNHSQKTMIPHTHVTTVSEGRGCKFEREQGLGYGKAISIAERKRGRIKCCNCIIILKIIKRKLN